MRTSRRHTTACMGCLGCGAYITRVSASLHSRRLRTHLEHLCARLRANMRIPPGPRVSPFQPRVTSIFAPAPAHLRCRPLAATPTGAAKQGVHSSSQLAAARKALSAAIADAVKREDYATAAQLHRDMETLNNQDPFYQLNQQLQTCIQEQRFQEAARLKAQLTELSSSALDSDLSNLKTASDTVTSGIRIKVQSVYRPTESTPNLGQYLFSYHVVITNESEDVVQLRHRHWLIRDSNGKTEEVRGPGVIGVQPILLPGKSFEYDSACPLRTPTGTMEGEYEMWLWSEADGEFNGQFEARIGRFKLSKD